MANTRTAAKRARQSLKKQEQNARIKTSTRTRIREALQALQAGNGKEAIDKAREAYLEAIRALSKAASKGTIPKTRAARKIQRLTALARKVLPQALPFK